MSYPIGSESLPSARGVVWNDSFRGRFGTSRGQAEVRLDAAGGARLRLAARPPSRPGDALARNAALPLNLRYAGAAECRHLIADAWLDGSAFASCVSEFRRGVRRAATPIVAPRPTPVGESHAYEALFADLARLEDPVDVVERAPEWELGPRVRGARIGVRVSPERQGLRLYRHGLKSSELAELGDSLASDALADLALRSNEAMRFARLALVDAGLTVEARLAARLADVGRVLETARAIAVVSAAVGERFQILTIHPDVARCYAHTFHLTNGAATS